MIELARLKTPFPSDSVQWRVGSKSKDGKKGMALAYIDSRAVMERLDEVCGSENWQDEYPHIGGTTVCRIGILIVPISEPTYSRDGEWIWKSDGAGATDFEAEKGQLSDAFKRCAVKWGIGRYLYDLDAPWVEIDQWGKILPVELERLASKLPNAAPGGVTVNQVSGLSKTPAKFWSQKNLTIPLTNPLTAEVVKAGGVWSPAVKEWWIGKFREGIQKAPTVADLARYQADNQHILDTFEALVTNDLCEACAIRAEQFSQQGG